MYLDYATANAILIAEGITDYVDDAGVSIRKAQRALDARYGRLYLSELVSTTQADLWPRVAFFGNDRKYYDAVIPDAIKQATAILAYNIQNDVDLTVTTSNVMTEKTKIGELESHVVYSGGGNTTVPDIWKTIDDIIWHLIETNSGWRISL